MNGSVVYNEHGGNIYDAARKTGGSLAEYIDFSANINPLGLAESVRQAILNSLDMVVHYPDPQGIELKGAIGRTYGIDEKNITLGNGAIELLYILCNILRPKRALIPVPAFSEYERAAKSSNARVSYYYLDRRNDFSIDFVGLLKHIETNPIDIIFLGNPNNPTGTLIDNHKLERLLKATQKYNTIVLVDESFIDFLPDDSQYTCRYLLARYPNTVILHSLTKFYAIPGLRLGFMLANPELTRCLHEHKDPWNVNTIAQYAGIAGLGDKQYRQNSRKVVQQAKEDLLKKLSSIPSIETFVPTVNYVLADIKNTNCSAVELRSSLLKYNILIRDCSNYPGLSDHFIRLAVKTPRNHDILVEKLKQVFEEKR